MKLKRNLVNASIESLISEPNPHKDYVEESKIGNAIAEDIADAVSPAIHKHSSNYRAVVQGLFEGGYLSTRESDFSFDQLIAYAIGVKMYHALDAFNELFDKLVAGGYTHPLEDGKQFNPSGDNYYSAMTFGVVPDEDDVWVCRDDVKDASEDEKIADELKARGIHRKVIFVKNQSPAWCYVLEFSIHTGEPKEFYIVRCMEEYDDPCKFQEVIDMDANFTKPGSFSAYNSKQIHRVIAKLNVDRMDCDEGWWEPKRVEYCLFNIYSGNDSLDNNESEEL